MIKLNLQFFGGSGSRLMSSTVNTNAGGEGYRVSTNSGGSPRIVANSYSNMIAGIEAQGYTVDSAYRRRNAAENEIVVYRNGQEYTISYTRYSDGEYEVNLRRR